MSQPEPIPAYPFKVEIDGLAAAHFTLCSGLGEIDGAAPPGQAESAKVSLRYGVTTLQAFWEWLMQAAAGNVERKNVSIVRLDTTGTLELLRFNLLGAWPQKFQGTEMEASSGSAAIESLNLVYERIERAG